MVRLLLLLLLLVKLTNSHSADPGFYVVYVVMFVFPPSVIPPRERAGIKYELLCLCTNQPSRIVNAVNLPRIHAFKMYALFLGAGCSLFGTLMNIYMCTYVYTHVHQRARTHHL